MLSTLLYISLTLKMQPSDFVMAISVCVFQNTSNRETRFLIKTHLFAERYFSKYLVIWSNEFFYNNYFLVTNTFSDQLRLDDKYFYSTASVWISFSFRINNYSEYTFSKQVLLPDNYFFRGRTFLGAGISWKQSFFLIVRTV